MALRGTKLKQPNEKLDYDFDYTKWLIKSANDSISTVSATTSPAGITATAVVIDNGNKVKLWAQGGTSSITYKVEITITTVGGRVKQDEIRIKVKEV